MFFSIVIPVYNVERYLKECVDSVLNQTFGDFELILVDDGSKDSSGLICDEYAAKDLRVKVIHKENGGQSTARNAGVATACGEFVVFLDSDDFIAYDKFLEDLHNTIDNNTDVVVFRYRKYYENRTVSVGEKLSDISYSSSVELLRELVKRDTFYCSCWSKTVRLKILKEHNINFDTSLSCEDMDWYYSVLEHVENFKVLDKECINYRQRENSVTSSFKKKSITDYIKTIDKWYERINQITNGEKKQVLLSSLAKLYCNLLISYSRHISKLKDVKTKIFSYKKLLKFNLNPRTDKFYKMAKVFGLSGTCFILNIIDKVR